MLWASGLCTIQTIADDSIWARRTICIMIEYRKHSSAASVITLFQNSALSCVFMDEAAAALCINTHVYLHMSFCVWFAYDAFLQAG